jgi:GT2 family glycosyltransferase
MRSSRHPNSTPKTAHRNQSAALPEKGREETTVQAAIPPIIDPDAFERFEGFRETTLAYFLDKEANNALRIVGRLLYSIVLELWHHSPEEPEGGFRHSARAVIADMRHIQGYLTYMGRETEASGLPPFEAHLSRRCPALAVRIKEIADSLEQELGSWRGEV